MWGGGLVTLVAAGAVLAALTVFAFRIASPQAVRVLVFVDVAFVIFAAGSFGSSSWSQAATTVLVCIVPLSCLVACSRVAWLRPAAPWLRRGRVDTVVVALGFVTIVLAALALTVWAAIAHPEPTPYLRDLQDLPVWLGVVGIVGFALVNPIWEEALFRGVILQELVATWGVPAAVVTQAALFGAAHWAGFPSGWVGMLMAAAWGLVLGIIRVRSGGIGLTYVVHVCANIAIGVLSLALLR